MIVRPFLLARKDVRMLARTRGLLLLLILYPLVVAAIVGGVLLQQGPPTVAFVNEDKSGDTVQIGDKDFRVADYVERAEKNGVDVKRMSRDEAERALDDGQVAGVLVIPQGTIAKLSTQLSGADLDFLIGDNPLGTIVAQRMRGVIYNINLSISDALIKANAGYLKKLKGGGEVKVGDRTVDLYGLENVSSDLEETRDILAEDPNTDEDLLDRLDRAIDFADQAGQAMDFAEGTLQATAAPVRLDVERTKGKSPLLTAQAMSFALAVSIAFVCVVLVGASLAAEKDEAVLGRLLHGLASAWQVVAGKLLLGALLAVLFSSGLFVSFALLEDQVWSRLPMLLGAVVLVSLACSGIGALIAVLVRDARTATLVGILLILPLAPLALVGTHGVVAFVEGMLPVAPARSLFNAVLFESSPWDTVRSRSIQLLLIAAVPSIIATRMLKRLA